MSQQAHTCAVLCAVLRVAVPSVVCCSAAIEKRWTVFSSMWYLWQELRFFGIPPSVRYVCHLLLRAVLMRLYEAHKMLVLWREYP